MELVIYPESKDSFYDAFFANVGYCYALYDMHTIV